ncbi:MAG: esterase family protein [Sphingomonas sp.]|nr:esterase family protein [Sphingomonas sp.]
MIRLILLVAAMLLSASSGQAAAQPVGRFVDLPAVHSDNIGSAHVTIWLPPGYDRGHRRYGVVYMHDAENLFFVEKSNFNKIWAADKSVTRLTAAGAIDPVIIVGIYSAGKDRARTYLPQRLYDTLTPALRAKADGFANGPIRSDAYLKFLTAELKPMIDATYRTRPDRRHTAVIGSSMGGLISLYAIAEYPTVFGMAGCVSTHWPLFNPTEIGDLQPDLLAAWKSYLVERLGPPRGRRIWFDHGDQTLDQFYGPWQSQIDIVLDKMGWQLGRDRTSRIYPGAAHEENAWAARLDAVFGWLMARHAR